MHVSLEMCSPQQAFGKHYRSIVKGEDKIWV
jgi:hypothetical protein